MTPDLVELTRVTKKYVSGQQTVLYADPSASLSCMQQAVPKFFATPHGRRETMSYHRGGLVVSCTDVHCSDAPKRRRSVFMYVYDEEDDVWMMWYVDDVDSIRQGKRLIDEALETGVLPA